MPSDRTKYSCPLGTRYGKDTSGIFSDDFKFQTWRQCWIALAESQYELGLAGVTKEQVEQLKQFVKNINYDVAEQRERIIRHDVMSHVYAFGQQCPDAAGIIHTGATSCDITDNTELIQMYAALKIIKRKLVNTIKHVRDFADMYKALPILAFTHYQPAQPTTLGLRASTWLHDLVLDYHQLLYLETHERLRGLKGATGTQASFLELADGDESKVKELNKRFIKKLGFEEDFPITTQTYTRKYDSLMLQLLACIGESAHKAGTDMRLMQNRKEMEEPFEKEQVGSSAMAYKRNPMRAERMCSLARDVVGNEIKPRMTSMIQWFERTLDDSAGRRIYVPQAFIDTDEVLNLYSNIMERPVVYPKVIERNLMNELPFLVTENIMMASVKRGKNRQELHEAIRQHSQEASRRIKEEGKDNQLLEMLANDPRIGMSMTEILTEIDVKKFIGRAPSIVESFLKDVDLILDSERELLGVKSKVEV
jgi:adenylosuccinate lyase